ncbi:MAG: ATP-dependent metallopeptidase FtsH/Yme1/Tma family protein, partial [candidate division Zixibacteria bacterium]|nr:ATP-dependent metallopeptidase FtsH/Yme1/Tma family protein [candidate division Zixibacteria bacterium]
MILHRENKDQQRPPRPPGRGEDPKGKKDDLGWKRTTRTILFWAAFFLLVIVAFKFLSSPSGDTVEIKYTEFLEQLESDNLLEVVFVEREIRGEFKEKYKPEDQ